MRECNERITATEDLHSSKESQELIERCDLFSQCDECNTSDSKRGTLILAASCAPADIAYPTDCCLLNEACTTVHKVIDNLFLQVDKKTARKPRCNKDKIRNTFLGIVRQKKPKYARIRQAKHIHLVELSGCLSSIDKLIASGASFAGLSGHLYRKLLVSSEVYRQRQARLEPRLSLAQSYLLLMTMASSAWIEWNGMPTTSRLI